MRAIPSPPTLFLIALSLSLTSCAPAPETPIAKSTTSESPAPVSPATPAKIEAGAPADVVKLRLESAIEHVKARELQTTNAFWTVFHGILGLGPGLALVEKRSGMRVNALDYILGGDFSLGEVRGLRFIPTADGLDVQTGPTFVGQGHQDQFVAEIAQWGTPGNKPVIVYGKEYSLMDFVRECQAHSRVTSNQELSWAIVVICQYLGAKVEWTNRFGEKLHFEDIVRYELGQSITEAACGGTHRLFGLTWAHHVYLRDSGKKPGEEEGVWKDCAKKLNDHVAMAKKYQNSDGSFSSSYFRGPGSTTDPKDRLGSSGHTLEWLALQLSDSELKEQWVKDGANAVSLMILDIQSAPMESGALYHATHGLILYYRRVYGWDHFSKEGQSNVSLQSTPESK